MPSRPSVRNNPIAGKILQAGAWGWQLRDGGTGPSSVSGGPVFWNAPWSAPREACPQSCRQWGRLADGLTGRRRPSRSAGPVMVAPRTTRAACCPGGCRNPCVLHGPGTRAGHVVPSTAPSARRKTAIGPAGHRNKGGDQGTPGTGGERAPTQAPQAPRSSRPRVGIAPGRTQQAGKSLQVQGGPAGGLPRAGGHRASSSSSSTGKPVIEGPRAPGRPDRERQGMGQGERPRVGPPICPPRPTVGPLLPSRRSARTLPV